MNWKATFLQIIAICTQFFIGKIAKTYNISYENAEDLCFDALVAILYRLKKGKAQRFPVLDDIRAQRGYLKRQIYWQFCDWHKKQKQLGQSLNINRIPEIAAYKTNVEEYHSLELLHQLIYLKNVPFSERQKRLWHMICAFTSIKDILTNLEIDRPTLYREKHRLFKKIRQYISHADIQALAVERTFEGSQNVVFQKNQEQDE